MNPSLLIIFTFLFFQKFGLSIITTSNVTCIPREWRSLIEVKQTLTDKYNLLSTWSGVECCKWRGVGCDSQNGHVIKLDLRTQVPLDESRIDFDKWLEGKLSPSLQNLKHLRYLDLSMNGFSGKIPKFLGLFKCLEYLNLSRSGFQGVVPHNLGNLSRLQYLDFKNCFDVYTLNGNSLFFTQRNFHFKFGHAPIIDNLGWVSSLSLLKYLDLSGITIDVDWFNPLNMLPSLHTLKLVWSDITIPSVKFSNFTTLNSLDLSSNGINSTIPVWLSNHTRLVHLKLSGNFFHGNIPDFVGMFSDLASIDLSYNSFETLMPDLLCNLSSLVSLDLSWNRFSGPIPMGLGQLVKLKKIDLTKNLLVGFLPETHFTMLKNLNYLALSSNSLAFNFSSRWIAPFQLQEFHASSCKVGPHFPKWLRTQTNIQRLDLFNSSIKDTIPEWFENILSRIIYLDLSKNQISGKLPRFHFDSSNLKLDGILMVNSNKFEGSLATFPSNVKILDLSDNLLSGHIPQTNKTMNPSLIAVNLSKNRFTGSIPIHLCNIPSIQILDLSHNNFSGRLPGCLGNLIDLNVMDLTNNSINGIIPSSLGSLTKMQSLHLHNNRFEGDLPVAFQYMEILVTLDLGNNMFMGTIPSWIGEKLSMLRFLNLQSNKFTGKIPVQLCDLNTLQYLSLAHNNITGTIPHCFGNLSGMKIISITFFEFRGDSFYLYDYEESILASTKGLELLYTKITILFLTSLDLSNNNIVGEIPDTLMYLVGLKSLNLSRNLIKGQIPMTIGDLKQLESLDFSMNKLSGRIPQSLTSLHFLSHLNLSFNNLSGPIPVGNQLQTLDDLSIYDGNLGLCGPPVSRSCNRNDAIYNHVGKDEGQDDSAGLWFYAGMGPGFVVGLVGLLGSLHFIRRWRVAYFEMIENVYHWLIVSILLKLACLRRNVFE